MVKTRSARGGNSSQPLGRGQVPSNLPPHPPPPIPNTVPSVDHAEGEDENQPHNSVSNSAYTANQDVVATQLAAMQQQFAPPQDPDPVQHAPPVSESQGQSHIAPVMQPPRDDVTRRLDSLEKLVVKQRGIPPPHPAADSVPHPLNTNIILEPYPAGFRIPQLETYDGTKDPDDHLHAFYSCMQAQNASDALMCKIFPSTLRVLEVNSFDQAVGITAVISGLGHERFRDSLLKHPATTFSEVNDRLLKFITAEEYALSQHLTPIKSQHPDWRDENPNRKRMKTTQNRGPMSTSTPRFGRPNSALPQQPTGKPPVNWTPFNLPRSQIFMQIKSKMDLRRPGPMKTAAATRDHTRYCDFHRDHGHITEQCNSLRSELESLAQKGMLNEYIQRVEQPRFVREQGPQHQAIRNPPNRQGVGYQQAPPPLPPPARVIHMITGGLEAGGLSSKQRKLYVREVRHQNRAQKQKFDDAEWKNQPITFTSADLETVVTPHNDPLVTSVTINNCEVQRVLVDTGSAPDIMYFHCFESLGIDPTLLQRYDGPIYGFNNQPVPVEGVLTMNVAFGSGRSYVTPSILQKPECSGRLIKWAVELGEFEITFQQRSAIRAQALADFIVECTPALLLGLQLALELKLSAIQVYSDSQLVVNQINSICEVVDPMMANSLSKIASDSSSHPRSVFVEVLDEPSFVKPRVMEISTNPGTPSWTDPILSFLRDGIVPEDRQEAMKLRRKASRYTLVDGVLYKRSFSLPLLRCLNPYEAEYALREVHEGVCGSHVGARTLAHKVLRQGYYWPNMYKDATHFVQRCLKCKFFAHLTHQPAEELTTLVAPWPFAQWGLDLLGPFIKGVGGVTHLIVGVDYFTKWVEARPLSSLTSKKVEDFVFSSIICRYGIPNQIVADNGT
ncbi:hypothetical protein SLEP1_g14191 [Rubroshorea leprosula]|uniref:Integrase catalytic domain-containing protein n=1 Tax=Rubroshorea leprosula TaxID=152421 RepID=A0AAV5IP31_9ROSI|nr:hypothetical protein SLEP1_g14191 [Rubroshorea leprosula]